MFELNEMMGNNEVMNYLSIVRGCYAFIITSQRQLKILYEIDMNEHEWNDFVNFSNRNIGDLEITESY